ncbi:metallophosphatase [Mycobacterium sp. MS1601]|uniref:metallophosphoesterase n=1 Tax=Mycobacterium sp. MS1601 TaxID=1936029 RepID=UPI0009791D61|nr:metallophosphoesterase [Mycobacterium sp. MS1601]AQA04868.1 metallophosphatase [Mycobacterium sp. MS1601]
MFIVIVSSILGLAHLYLWKRLIKDTTAPGRTRRILTGVLLGLAVLLVATLIVPRMFGVEESAWFAWPGYIWFALVGYLLLALLVMEPVRLALLPWVRRRPKVAVSTVPDIPDGPSVDSIGLNRRVFLARASAVAAGAASVGLVGVGAATALGPPQVLQVPVRLRRLDPAFSGFRIAVVSDIHLGPLLGRKHTERIVRMINETEPDLVAIVGDLVDGTVEELGHAAEPLQDLVSREGSFFVTGNHEYFVEDTVPWLLELERFGVAPLRNENTLIRRGGAAFNLAGVNDLAGEQRGDPPDYERALAGVDPDAATVLLAHQPVMVEEAATRGVDLQLSGHTHGGQTWPFQYIVGSVQPSLAGLSTHQDTQLYVSRGAGFWGPPVRVGVPPDISILSLDSAQ